MIQPTDKRERNDGKVIELCLLDDLEDCTAQGFDPFGDGRDALFVVRRGNSLWAYRNLCPHQGASLPWRDNAYLDAAGNHIVCSAHGAKFDIFSGECFQGAALGRSLDPVAISVSDGGAVRAVWPAKKSTGD